ncbi:MAG: DVU0298 family protein [Planctomycetota bacterium]|jgi:hypothetical protein
MNKEKLSGRELKNKIFDLLSQKDFKKGLKEICRLPARQVVNPLFSLLFSLDENLKWRSITAFGEVVARLAECDLESARIIMRRLMWNLNDESGGIGWGSPEAMGEIMARSPRLAEEYSTILVSYIRPDGNFLEHEVLQRGVLWGLGRLAYARSELVSYAAAFLPPFLESQDPTVRGLAVWSAGALPVEKNLPFIKPLAEDGARLKLFVDGEMIEKSIRKLVAEVLGKIDS